VGAVEARGGEGVESLTTAPLAHSSPLRDAQVAERSRATPAPPVSSSSAGRLEAGRRRAPHSLARPLCGAQAAAEHTRTAGRPREASHSVGPQQAGRSLVRAPEPPPLPVSGLARLPTTVRVKGSRQRLRRATEAPAWSRRSLSAAVGHAGDGEEGRRGGGGGGAARGVPAAPLPSAPRRSCRAASRAPERRDLKVTGPARQLHAAACASAARVCAAALCQPSCARRRARARGAVSGGGETERRRGGPGPRAPTCWGRQAPRVASGAAATPRERAHRRVAGFPAECRGPKLPIASGGGKKGPW